MPSRAELHKAEHTLRAYDKALRLRVSEERNGTILVERKTFRGRYGRVLMGESYTQDAGRRREEGHVLVAYLPAFHFSVTDLMDNLKRADSWRGPKRLWEKAEEQDGLYAASKKYSQHSDSKQKAADVFDRYAWQEKMRVTGGI